MNKQNRRFTRLTNGFSKKLENHAYMLAITMVFYNFCRKHRSLGGKTPAMAAGITSYVWTASDLLSSTCGAPPSRREFCAFSAQQQRELVHPRNSRPPRGRP